MTFANFTNLGVGIDDASLRLLQENGLQTFFSDNHANAGARAAYRDAARHFNGVLPSFGDVNTGYTIQRHLDRLRNSGLNVGAAADEMSDLADMQGRYDLTKRSVNPANSAAGSNIDANTPKLTSAQKNTARFAHADIRTATSDLGRLNSSLTSEVQRWRDQVMRVGERLDGQLRTATGRANNAARWNTTLAAVTDLATDRVMHMRVNGTDIIYVPQMDAAITPTAIEAHIRTTPALTGGITIGPNVSIQQVASHSQAQGEFSSAIRTQFNTWQSSRLTVLNDIERQGKQQINRAASQLGISADEVVAATKILDHKGTMEAATKAAGSTAAEAERAAANLTQEVHAPPPENKSTFGWRRGATTVVGGGLTLSAFYDVYNGKTSFWTAAKAAVGALSLSHGLGFIGRH